MFNQVVLFLLEQKQLQENKRITLSMMCLSSILSKITRVLHLFFFHFENRGSQEDYRTIFDHMLKDCAPILFPVLGSDIFENKEPLLSDSISITSLAFERSVEFLRPCVATSAPIDKFVKSFLFSVSK